MTQAVLSFLGRTAALVAACHAKSKRLRLPPVATAAGGVKAVSLGVAGWAFALCAHALTPAGTVIHNHATLTFSQGTVAGYQTDSNITHFVVQELIDVALQWVDGAAVPVGSPDTARALTFKLSNTGNGPQQYTLTRQPEPAVGQFVPEAASIGGIWIENGLQPGFQATGPFADTLYVPGHPVPLAAGASQAVYAVSDIPPGRAPGHEGAARLLAASATPGAGTAAPGANLSGAGTDGLDVVVAHGHADSTGRYGVSTLVVALQKAITAIQDPGGGSTLMSGAQVTYTITATLSGSGTASNFTISDPLPVVLHYLPGSLQVNGAPCTDAVDGDLAEYSAATQTVTLRAGAVAVPASFVLSLKATVE